jgi:hypothetical protein
MTKFKNFEFLILFNLIYFLNQIQVYYYELTEKSLVMKGEPDYYSQGKEHFPLSITSILAISDSNEYYFFNRHKYCKRPFSIRNATDGTVSLINLNKKL